MIGGLAVEILFIALLISINGVLAMAEIAIVSSRKARLQHLVNEGNTRAGVALKLANEPSDFLSMIQVGITLVGILAGVFGGATIADQLEDWLVGSPFLRNYAGAISIGTVVLVITYLNLILGELAPKRFALQNPESIASAISVPIQWLGKITSPLVKFLSRSTNLVLRVMGVHGTDLSPVTEEEIKVMIGEATEAGVFQAAEQNMVEGVFRLGDRRIESIVTPRTEVVWLDLEESVEEQRHKIIESNHTRLPVARGNLDRIEGVVHAKTLLGQCMRGEDLNIGEAMGEPVFVPESTPALRVLDMIKDTGHQVVLVIDEFGGFLGLVTLDDLLEAVVGDIQVLGGPFEQGIVRREDGSILFDGLVPIDEFMDSLGITDLPNMEQANFQTVGGFIMTTLGRIPSAGDYFEYEGLRYEVVDMDGLRIDKVLVYPI